ncbi:MAG: SirB2 family protein [Arenicellales bacterium]|jgi:uncharacterized membrane protein SirB2
MMTNPVLLVHVTSVLLSISGFIFRGILRFSGSDLANRKWLKIAPHIIDTVLIVSAIMLYLRSGLELFSTPWLMAKIIALLLYIALGLIAFRFGKTRTIRLVAFFEAILVFAYIIGVAVTRNPFVFF